MCLFLIPGSLGIFKDTPILRYGLCLPVIIMKQNAVSYSKCLRVSNMDAIYPEGICRASLIAPQAQFQMVARLGRREILLSPHDVCVYVCRCTLVSRAK